MHVHVQVHCTQRSNEICFWSSTVATTVRLFGINKKVFDVNNIGGTQQCECHNLFAVYMWDKITYMY